MKDCFDLPEGDVVTIVRVDGLRVRGRVISKKRLVSMWGRLTEKPLPMIAAFQLGDRDFDCLVELRKCRDDERRELQEWGRVLSPRGTDACVFNADESMDFDYVILVRENPYHPLEEVLEHELSHIIRGDL